MPESKRGVVAGFMIGGFVLLAISFFAYAVRQSGPERAPAIRFVLQPVDSARSGTEVPFVTDAPLESTSQGWVAGDLHPHALVDGAMIMPMQNDIRAIGGDTFALRLSHLGKGVHAIRLFWANGAHIPTGDTAVTTIELHD